jgi:protein-tyrosine-phosphatase
MAESVLKDLILDEVEHNHIVLPIDVLSAGINAMEGQPASRNAVETAARYGLTLGFHRSRALSSNLVRHSGLILTMEKRHTDFIAYHWPDVTNVHELKRYGREDSGVDEIVDIPDPMGFGPDVYREVFEAIRAEVTRVSRILFPLIKERYGLRPGGE